MAQINEMIFTVQTYVGTYINPFQAPAMVLNTAFHPHKSVWNISKTRAVFFHGASVFVESEFC